VDERELDRLAFEAVHDYDFRLAALVRQLREHRTMLRRYLTAQALAAQTGPGELPAATQVLLEAYNDAWTLLGEPAAKIVPGVLQKRVTARSSPLQSWTSSGGSTSSCERRSTVASSSNRPRA
jgi:hypothetical protein